jgi:hypothetical protein
MRALCVPHVLAGLCPAQVFGNNYRIHQGRAPSESSRAIAYALPEMHR